MKTPLLSALLTACGLAISGPSARAQDTDRKPAPETVKPAEAPPGDNADKPRPRRPEDGDQSKPRPDGEHRPAHGDRDHNERRQLEPELKPTAFIGVFTRPLSDEVRAQTGLAEGFGLIIEEIMPDSPAQKAGLKQHDVLVLLGDQKLINQDQLSVLVRAEKKDADITFTIKRAGMEQKITVKVGEKMMPVAMEREGSRPGPFEGWFSGRDGERLGQELREQAQKFRQGMKGFQEGMKGFQERMQDWARDPQNRPVPQPPHDGDRPGDGKMRRDGDHGPADRGPRDQPFQGPRPDGDRKPNPGSRSESSSRSSNGQQFKRNIMRRDDSGEYTLTENNGAKVFTVKPVGGEEQTFIVNTQDQREAVPEQFRAKLHELENVDGKVKIESPPSTDPKPGK